MTLKNAVNTRKRYGVTAFLWGLLLGAAIVVPIMVIDNGYFLYYGDFNAQQIPFYRLAHDEILSGHLYWSHLTDLGANFIASYSFYVLGSPFFLITLLLPSAWVPYAMGPLLILKLGCCSLSAYIFLRRYTRDRLWAVIGGLLYAFSSFSLYNIFFFHFHEAIIIFPLMLAAADEFHATRRRGVMALSVAAAAIVNYYFFFGQVVFIVIWYTVRMITRGYRFRLKEFLLFAAECVIGFLISLFLLLPSVASVTGNYRVTEIINGWGALLYPSKRYLQLLIALLFPADLPAKMNFVPDGGGQWSSIAAYLPVFSAVYVIAYIRSRKKSFSRLMLLILVIMALVPALNSTFQAMNVAYYARWFYMLTLVMIMITVRAIECVDDNAFRKGFIVTAVCTAAAALVIGLMPYESFRNSHTVLYKFGIEDDPSQFWLLAGVSAAGLILTLILRLIRRRHPRALIRAASIALSVFIIAYGSIYLWCGKYSTDFSDSFMIDHALNYGADLTLSDIKTVRSDFYEGPDNIAMYWEIPTIQTFHSVVPGSLMEFYNSSGEQRDVASRPDPKYYGFRALLSVKYLFRQSGSYENKGPLMPGFAFVRAENGFDIYQNKYYLPMGFTYDVFYSQEEYLNLSNSFKHLALLKGLVLSQHQMKKYADITGYTDGMYLNLNAQFDENHPQNVKRPKYQGFDSVTDTFFYNEQEYVKDVEKLQQNTCDTFRYTDNGFEAVFHNKGGDNLLFFSIPYDEGWTASVNGVPAEIEQVNIGFMAVKVNGGETSRITFTYRTPLLREGIILTGVGLGLFLLYLTVSLIVNKGKLSASTYRRRYKIIQNNRNTRKTEES